MNHKLNILVICLILQIGIFNTCFSQKLLSVFRGNTPKIDGKISEGEYADATQLNGTNDWTREFSPNGDTLDLSLKAWIKHDGTHLYFAFDVTDDIIYGIDTPRWLPKGDSLVHDFSLQSSPWFGDGIELYMNPYNKWNLTKDDLVAGNGLSWQMECSTHKSFKHKLRKGGLLEANPRTQAAWTIYQEWIKSGAMQAAVRLKNQSEGRGYIIEWKIAANPCLEVENGIFWTPSMGAVNIGLNIEVQDFDEKLKGEGNWGNVHHVDVWSGLRGKKSKLEQWGTMVLHPEPRKNK